MKRKVIDTLPVDEVEDVAPAANVTPIKSALLTSATVVPPIKKPKKPGFLDRFKSRRPPNISGVTVAVNPLKICKLADAGDFTRLHPDEDFGWSDEQCFVSVPIKGEKQPQLHLIEEELAMSRLSSKQIQRHRLALAAKPYDSLFLCIVPSQNLDNSFNKSALKYCQEAKSRWLKVVSRKAIGYDDYIAEYAEDEDAFPETNWGARSVDEWCEITFREISIFEPNHPGWLRLIGAKQKLD